jgi:uncharacterized membrane protein YkvA (DUF1232 family)
MRNPNDLNRPRNGAFFRGIADHVRLVWALWLDPRISPLLKILPLGSIVYLISPFDMVIPLVDDVGVLWFFTYLFIELSPEEIVEEHRRKINHTIYREWKEKDDAGFTDEDIEDAEFTEKQDH